MSLMRFAERRRPLTRDEFEGKVASTGHVMDVDIHIGRPFRGHVTVTCTGQMKNALPSVFSTMTALKGHEVTFHFDTTKSPDNNKPITVAIYAEKRIHVREVRLRE